MCVSFVVPAFNEEANIVQVLNRIISCVADQFEFEIIAIDNCSSDTTLGELNDVHGVRVIELAKKHTVSHVRNLGWRLAKYKTVAFIDGDVLITQEWVDEIVRLQPVLMQENVIVGATYELSECPGWIETSWFSSMRKTGRRYINGGNLITLTCVLERLNGFDERLISGEDVDFCRRAEALDIKISLNKKLKVFHEGYPKTWRHFFFREVWHGVGDLRSLRDFFRSRTALLAFTLFTLPLCGFILIIFQRYLFSSVAFALFFLLNLLLIFLKFKISNIGDASKIYLLMLIYNFARVFSVFRRGRI